MSICIDPIDDQQNTIPFGAHFFPNYRFSVLFPPIIVQVRPGESRMWDGCCMQYKGLSLRNREKTKKTYRKINGFFVFSPWFCVKGKIVFVDIYYDQHMIRKDPTNFLDVDHYNWKSHYVSIRTSHTNLLNKGEDQKRLSAYPFNNRRNKIRI